VAAVRRQHLSNGADLHQWVKLVPDQFRQLRRRHLGAAWPPAPNGLGAAQEHILPDGRFYQAGGEYVYFLAAGSSSNDHNGVQLYDPVTNTWSLASPASTETLQDTGSSSLRDGSIVSQRPTVAEHPDLQPQDQHLAKAAGSRPAPSGEDGWVHVRRLGRRPRRERPIPLQPGTSTWGTWPPRRPATPTATVDSSMSTLM